MRYCLSLSYVGAGFCGWQVQPGAPSVQECLEKTLSRLLSTRVAVTGAGRTDSGVNAVNYVAHFELDRPLPFGDSDFCYKLNAMLPRSVVVHGVSCVADDFNARFSARERSYTYFLHRRKDPFAEAFSWRCGYPGLDFGAMNEACAFLLGRHGFSCFEKTGGDNKTSLCTVSEAFWAPYVPSHVSVMGYAAVPDGEVPDYWYFRISADRFLRNMVRAVVGSLIEVGRGRHEPGWIADLIAAGTRSDAGESVPGHALFLNRVRY